MYRLYFQNANFVLVTGKKKTFLSHFPTSNKHREKKKIVCSYSDMKLGAECEKNKLLATVIFTASSLHTDIIFSHTSELEF